MQEPFLVGIDSSSRTCAAALARGAELLAERSEKSANIHSKMLLPFIEEVCRQNGIGLNEIGAVVLSSGPGSFTGLRIGYSVAKGIVHALNIPLIEVPTLDVWAHQAGPREIPLVPVINAHRGELFFAFYRHTATHFTRTSEFHCTAPEEMEKTISSPVLFTGGDALSFRPKLQSVLGEKALFPEPFPSALSMNSLLTLGYQSFRAGQFADIAACEPLYLRKFRGAS